MVVLETCEGLTTLLALDPGTGRSRWGRSLPESRDFRLSAGAVTVAHEDRMTILDPATGRDAAQLEECAPSCPWPVSAGGWTVVAGTAARAQVLTGLRAGRGEAA